MPTSTHISFTFKSLAYRVADGYSSHVIAR